MKQRNVNRLKALAESLQTRGKRLQDYSEKLREQAEEDDRRLKSNFTRAQIIKMRIAAWGIVFCLAYILYRVVH